MSSRSSVFHFLIISLLAKLIAAKYRIPILVVYGSNRKDLNISVQLAIREVNGKNLYLELDAKQIFLEELTKQKTLLSEEICRMIRNGTFALFSLVGESDYIVINSISQSFELPHFNLNSRPPHVVRNASFELNLRPPLLAVVADFARKQDWSAAHYIYDSPTGLANLLELNVQLQNFTQKRYLTADVHQLDTGEKIMGYLKRLQKDSPDKHQHVIIDLSDSQLQRDTLGILAKHSRKTRNFHYLVANYDMSKRDLILFKSGWTNITGFKLFDRTKNSILRKFLVDWKTETKYSEISPEAAFAYDSILTFAKTLDLVMSETDYKLLQGNFRNGKMYNRDKPGLKCHADEILTFEHGKTLIEAAKKLNFDGLSGKIQFHSEGERKNFTLEMVETSFMAQSQTSPISSTSSSEWLEGYGFLIDDSRISFQRKVNEVKSLGRKNIVTTVLSEPFVMVKNAKENENLTGNDRYEGYCVDLMEKLFTKIGFIPYEIQIVKDGKYGNPSESGDWNGMVGELLRGEAEVAVAPLTITKARQRVVAFSKPFMSLGITIMIRKPDNQVFSVFSFMSPLSTEIWMYIIFAYVAVSIVIFVVSRFSPYEWRVEETPRGFTISNDFSVYNCLWFTLAAFMQQGTDILPRSLPGRIASSAWWFFTMIIVSSYTANLAAFLTLEKMQTPIESVDDLAKQTKIKYGIQGGGSTAEFFKDSTVQVYQRMWQYMSSQNPTVFTNTYDEGVKRVRESKGRYAFLLESTANNYRNTRIPCDTMKVGTELNSVGYGVATKFDSELRDKINLAILDLQEKGELKKLENRWWFDRGQCGNPSQDQQSASLNLIKVAGIFYILIGGMTVAIVASLVEFLYRSRLEARKANRTLKSAMTAQFSLTLHGENPQS